MARTAADAVRRIGIKLAALAQVGLTFAADDYDRDRYQQVGRLAAELLSALSGRPADEFAVELGRDGGYATPKIDVRGVIFDDHERVLLMREKSDGRWSLPGGWADPGDAPSAAVTREILEETGLVVTCGRLLGTAELPGPPGAVIDVSDYLAVVAGGELAPGDDAADARWVTAADLDSLPLTNGLTEYLAAWGAYPA